MMVLELGPEQNTLTLVMSPHGNSHQVSDHRRDKI